MINRKEYNKKYYENNKEYFKKHAADYYPKHLDEIKKQQRIYYKNNQEKLKAYTRKYYNEHHKQSLDYAKRYGENYFKNNREKILERNRRYAKTENGKKVRLKNEHKRRRKLGFNELYPNELDEPFVWHHVNDIDVVALPVDIHSIYGGRESDVHRECLSYIVDQLYRSK